MNKSTVYSKQNIKRLTEYPDILTVEETSELLGVSSKTVYKLIKQGVILSRPVGRAYKIPKEALLNYLGIKV